MRLISDLFESGYRSVLSIMRPDVYQSLIEKETRNEEENGDFIGYDDFMKLVDGIKTED